ncbi:iron-siderophore ABC transporter substrate-binding protein [Halopseudomonas sp. SMJS2]|uniref:iron-siderophore ABC transporter substrate-binding protein n=1 Tax=Halopseudomonas sp. SMJS2 TaxID=3041098 RepID=UPI00245369C0|nr:iron-siderophore ABC transporter substrate-binding protein [Halopseudomonas sp. SMJS2]WGK61564.1 iron-siderophore ABC transporter substrate-binding protein [Halopseudomonas sp. SMJS2]
MTTSIYRSALALLLAGLASVGALAETRQVEDAQGNQLTVPAEPKRIVTLSELDLDTALALGITPVGTTDGRGQASPPRYLEGKVPAQTRSVGLLNDPNLEALLELQPDLILTGPQKPEQLAILNEIAPTAVSYALGEYWMDATLRVANILNREAEGQQLLERYKARAAEGRDKLSEHQGETISIARWNPKGPAYMLKDSFASTVAHDLGLVRPAHQQEPGTTHSMSLSLESLAMLDADWLVVGTLATTGDAVNAMRQAEQTPMFLQMESVKANQYSAVDGSVWTSTGGPLAALQVIEDIETMVLDSEANATAVAATP